MKSFNQLLSSSSPLLLWGRLTCSTTTTTTQSFSSSPSSTFSSPSSTKTSFSFFSTSTEQQKERKPASEKIKKMLKELYLQVHPDLFSHYPKEQKANATSFQNLQNFIRDCDSSSSSLHSRRYPLKFYFLPQKNVPPLSQQKKERQQIQKEKEKEKEKAAPLLSITYELSFDRMAGRREEERASFHSRQKHKKLAELFRKCQNRVEGLKKNWSSQIIQDLEKDIQQQHHLHHHQSLSFSGKRGEGERGDIFGSEIYRHNETLHSFIQHWAPVLYRNSENLRTQERQISLLRSILIRERRIQVSYDEPIDSPAKELEVIRQLLKPLDCAKFLTDTSIHIFSPSSSSSQKEGLDRVGRICLRFGNERNWSHVLSSIDSSSFFERKGFYQSITGMEVAITRDLGFESIWRGEREFPFLKYHSLLSEWTKSLKERDEWNAIRSQGIVFRRMEILVTSRLDVNDNWRSEDLEMVSCNSGRGFTSDLSKGTIVLPMSSLLQEREKEKEREKENGFVKEMENENEKFEWDWSSWIEFLVSGGLSAARRFDTLYAQKKEIDSLITYVRRTLLLSSLRQGNVTNDQMRRFCFHIRTREGGIGRLMEGMNVLVTHKFSVNTAKGFLEIPWDFEF